MIAAPVLAQMDDGHLIASLHADFDPPRTPVERELLRRFEEIVQKKEFFDVLEEHEFTPEEIRAIGEGIPGDVNEAMALLNLLAEEDITTGAEWRERLALLKVLDDVEIYDPHQLKELLDIASVVG